MEFLVFVYLICKDYESAVAALSKPSELLVVEHKDDLHDSLAEVYLYYGKALLGLSREQNEALGDAVPKTSAEDSENDEEPDEGIDSEESEKIKLKKIALPHQKLKLPEKAIRVLILIMIFVQTCSCGNGACFGPVWKTRVYNDDRGYVGVNKGKQIFANSTINYLYKISTFNASTFYLFEESTRKFLCWKKSLVSMVALDYKRINQNNHWNLCKFRDVPSKTKPDTHVHLHLADHPEVRMQFDSKGRYLPIKRIEKCLDKKKIGGRIHPRHAKSCRGHNNFILWPGDHKNCCRDAYKIFCKSHLRFMSELSKSCQDMRSTSSKCY